MSNQPLVFILPEQLRGEKITVSGGDLHHLTRVLRLGPGDIFTALDGTGLEYIARIAALNRESLEAVVEERRERRTEPRLRLTIGQALPKGEKMETVVRKGTEVGAAAFWPLRTERCVAAPTGERLSHRLDRWRKVAAEAASQSGRAVIPEVTPPRTWREALAEFDRFELVLLPWEGETRNSLRSVLESSEKPGSVLLLIGPEGGLTRDEAAAARGAGARTVTLGPRILRTETAALVVSSVVLYHFGEMEMPGEYGSNHEPHEKATE